MVALWFSHDSSAIKYITLSGLSEWCVQDCVFFKILLMQSFLFVPAHNHFWLIYGYNF